MPEDVNLLQGNQAGQLDDQTANVSTGEETQPGQPEVNYISREEAQQLIDAALRRQKQSFNDVLSNRIKQELYRLKQAGIQATEEQVAQLIGEGHSEPEGKEAQQQSSIPQQTTQQPAQVSEGSYALDPIENQAIAWMKEDGVELDNPILLEIYKVQAMEGVHLTDNDPETKKVERGKTLFETMRSIHAAILEKKERESRQGSPARLPSLSSGSSARPDYSRMSGTEILEEYYSKKR